MGKAFMRREKIRRMGIIRETEKNRAYQFESMEREAKHVFVWTSLISITAFIAWAYWMVS